ncbi:MAG: hypothetical protein J6V21_09335 [Alistipes sp.]|nr:hypothetical protein [Alistipes sp.]
MKRFLLIVVTLILAFTASAQETAQSEQSKSTEQSIAELSTRLEKSEKRIAAFQEIRKYAHLTAFFQAQYDWLDDRKGNANTGTSTFHIRRARMNLAGTLYSGEKGAKIDYRFLFDVVRIPQNPLIEAWVRYQPFKELGVQLGQFMNPFSYEAATTSAKYEFIDFSYVVRNLVKLGSEDLTGYTSSGRDTGIQLFGGFIHRNGYSIINYNLAILNGNGINLKDDNKSKDIVGRLTIKPIKELNMAIYYQRGEANLSGFDAEKYADYNWKGNAEYVKTHRWGGGFAYTSDKIFLRGEYIVGLTGNLVSEGAFLQGVRYFSLPKNAGRVWVGGMVDYFRRDCGDYTHRNNKDANVDMRYTLCAGYWPIKYLRLQLAYSLEHRVNYTFPNNRPFGNGVKFMATVLL